MEHPRQNVVVVGFVQKTEEVKMLKATSEVGKRYMLNCNEKRLAGMTGLRMILIMLYTTLGDFGQTEGNTCINVQHSFQVRGRFNVLEKSLPC